MRCLKQRNCSGVHLAPGWTSSYVTTVRRGKPEKDICYCPPPVRIKQLRKIELHMLMMSHGEMRCYCKRIHYRMQCRTIRPVCTYICHLATSWCAQRHLPLCAHWQAVPH